jgi:hypothetical protein
MWKEKNYLTSEILIFEIILGKVFLMSLKKNFHYAYGQQ